VSPQPEKLINVDEAAEILCLSKRTVWQMALERRLPCVRLSKRCVRFRASELSRWIEERSEAAE
jgi:excisionase family DNA binding protein